MKPSMSIYETLKTPNVRVTFGRRWLILSGGGLYTVYEPNETGHVRIIVYEGTDESAACQSLLEG